MNRFTKWWNATERKITGVVMSEGKASSQATNNFDGRVYPLVEFNKCREYFLSSPRVYNTAKGFLLDIMNRDFHFAGDGYNKEIEIMENWAKIAKPKIINKKMLINLMVCGVEIISPKDWKDLQLSTIKAKIRDDDGNSMTYIQEIKGQEKPLPATDFIEISFLQLDREAWPIGMFHSLFYRDWIDVDGKDARPLIELQRQAMQDTMKIHHKFASPRVFYNVPDVNKETFDNDIVPLIEGMAPGDRAGFNAVVEPKMETVDTTARFHESVVNIAKEVDLGVGSSKNRMIVEPSAMADAREANKDDDDMTMALMDIIKEFYDEHVIPKITGLTPGEVVFEWGAKDTFNLDYPEELRNALHDNLIDRNMARKILTETYRWPELPDIPDPEPQPMEKPQAPNAESLMLKEQLKLANNMLSKDIADTLSDNK